MKLFTLHHMITAAVKKYLPLFIFLTCRNALVVHVLNEGLLFIIFTEVSQIFFLTVYKFAHKSFSSYDYKNDTLEPQLFQEEKNQLRKLRDLFEEIKKAFLLTQRLHYRVLH